MLRVGVRRTPAPGPCPALFCPCPCPAPVHVRNDGTLSGYTRHSGRTGADGTGISVISDGNGDGNGNGNGSGNGSGSESGSESGSRCRCGCGRGRGRDVRGHAQAGVTRTATKPQALAPAACRDTSRAIGGSTFAMYGPQSSLTMSATIQPRPGFPKNV